MNVNYAIAVNFEKEIEVLNYSIYEHKSINITIYVQLTYIYTIIHSSTKKEIYERLNLNLATKRKNSSTKLFFHLGKRDVPKC